MVLFPINIIHQIIIFYFLQKTKLEFIIAIGVKYQIKQIE